MRTERLKWLKKLFTEHPASVGNTYLQHMAFSLYLGFQGLMIFLAATIHSIFPFVFQTTTTRLNLKIYEVLQERMRQVESISNKVE